MNVGLENLAKEFLLQDFVDVAPESAARWLVVPGDWRRPLAQQHFEILWDASRSYGQVWPRPGKKEVTSFYDLEAYYTHGTRLGVTASTTAFEQKLQNKLSWLVDKGVEPDKNWWLDVLGSRKLRILEVGCGNGANLSTFRALGHETVGVEPDTKALEQARNDGHLVYRGTAEALPSEVVKDRFDVVVFIHVLEHCIDPLLAVKNVVDVMKPGGQLVAEVPNNECLGATRFGELWHWLDVPRHLNFFTSDSLSTLISAAGLDVQSLSFRGYCRQFSSNWKSVQAHISDMMQMPKDKRVGRASYWRYLLETAWAEDRKKYDSVRILGALSE